MKLTDLLGKVQGIEVYRDGEFDSLGLMISDPDLRLLSFIEKEEYINHLSKSVNCIITTKEVAALVPEKYGVIIWNQPRIDFFTLHNYLAKNEKNYVNSRYETVIGNNCKIARNAVISEDNVTIGNNVIIEEFTIIRENVVIGDNSIIRAGSIIGGIGFEFKRNGNVSTIPVEHCGGVLIEDNVEIQYNSCIDKAIYPWDRTVIGEFSKIDNLVHVGHAAKIGKRTFLAANCLVGGRTIIGDDCWIGISTTLRNGLVIGNNASINMGAVVTKNVGDNASVSGNFAIEHSKFIRFIKSLG